MVFRLADGLIPAGYGVAEFREEGSHPRDPRIYHEVRGYPTAPSELTQAAVREAPRRYRLRSRLGRVPELLNSVRFRPEIYASSLRLTVFSIAIFDFPILEDVVQQRIGKMAVVEPSQMSAPRILCPVMVSGE